MTVVLVPTEQAAYRGPVRSLSEACYDSWGQMIASQAWNDLSSRSGRMAALQSPNNQIWSL